MKRILVADDDKMVRDLFKDILEEEGYQVITAENGAIAFDLIQYKHFDLVFSDVQMPGINGMQLLERIKKTGIEIPVVMFSGKATETTVEKAKELGAKEFLQLPIKPDVIKKITKEIFSLYERKGELGKILIVDDHKETREVLMEALNLKGYSAEEAENGKVALEKIKNKNYDIVFLDIHMPVMNGVEAIKEIKNISPMTFVVIITGEATDEELEKALKVKAGYYTYLCKPIKLETFLLTVKNLMKESIEYRKKILEEERLKQRNKLEVILDDIKGDIKRFREFTSSLNFKKWAVVIIFSLIAGLFTFYIVENLSYFINRTGGFMDRIEGYLHRDEQRELKQMRGE